MDAFVKLESQTDRCICLEVNPPRGVDLDHIFERPDGHLDGVDFLNVTDSALAKMKMAPFPFASELKRRYGLEALVNMSCRDRNLIAIQGDLLAAWMTGVRSVVALTGDAVTIGDSPDRKGVFEVNSIGLLNAIASLNSGHDVNGNELKGAPRFFPGVVVNPNARNSNAEIRRLSRKKEAGARYALSQPVFDEEVSTQFFMEASKVGIPLIMGLLPVKGAASLDGISSIPGIRVSDQFKARMSAASPEEQAHFSIAHCVELAQLNRPYVHGFHIISGATPKLAISLVQELAGLKKGG